TDMTPTSRLCSRQTANHRRRAPETLRNDDRLRQRPSHAKTTSSPHLRDSASSTQDPQIEASAQHLYRAVVLRDSIVGELLRASHSRAGSILLCRRQLQRPVLSRSLAWRATPHQAHDRGQPQYLATNVRRTSYGNAAAACLLLPDVFLHLALAFLIHNLSRLPRFAKQRSRAIGIG